MQDEEAECGVSQFHSWNFSLRRLKDKVIAPGSSFEDTREQVRHTFFYGENFLRERIPVFCVCILIQKSELKALRTDYRIEVLNCLKFALISERGL